MKTVAGLPYPRLFCDRFSFGPEAESVSADSAPGQADSRPDSLQVSVPDKASGSLELLTDPGLYEACGVRIAFTGRQGGVSTGSYGELNLGAHVEDDLRCVLQNRQRLMRALGVRDVPLLVPNQVHGTRIVTVDDPSSSETVQQDASQGADGIQVLCPHVAALLCFADCTPVVLVAPSGAFAVVHAGWRGVYGHIAVSALSSLCARTGCRPSDCNVYIGPFIHGECFEVGQDLADRFADEFGESCIVSPRHVDMAKALVGDLVSAGADPDRIVDAGICTVCNHEDYFSYRASGGVCGRHGAFAVRIAQ